MIEISAQPGPTGNYHLRAEQHLTAPLEEVFAFFSDANQLETITPPGLHFSVVTPRPIIMEVGSTIDYRLRVRGIPLRWRSRITKWEPPYLFIDEQIRGPYRKWRHLHTFEEREGLTVCRDEVDYRPLGGALAHMFFVKKDLQRIFAYRAEALAKEFGMPN